ASLAYGGLGYFEYSGCVFAAPAANDYGWYLGGGLEAAYRFQLSRHWALETYSSYHRYGGKYPTFLNTGFRLAFGW
ncbi:MAG: hypothetical protein AAF804_19750, partial [Bacteroidota bacterium]